MDMPSRIRRRIPLRWAERLGIPDRAIVTEENSRTTFENASETKRLLGPASILLVSSASHLPRAVMLFGKQAFASRQSRAIFRCKTVLKKAGAGLILSIFFPMTGRSSIRRAL